MNMDQTGVHLVSASSWTYEMQGSSDVPVIGAEDKRQITVCVAASLRGDLLPLQCIFQGKTARSLSSATPASIAAHVDVTQSENQWSTWVTMQRWITNVLLPHTERMIELHHLDSNAHILLLLDCWAVHNSAEFRGWLSKEHPRIHLVFVPANCTSKLLLAAATFQKLHHIELQPVGCSSNCRTNTCRRNRWNLWTTWHGVTETVGSAVVRGELERVKRTQATDSGWLGAEQPELVRHHQREATHRCSRTGGTQKLNIEELPEGEEPDGYEAQSDSDEDELDTTKPRIFGKQSTREKTQPRNLATSWTQLASKLSLLLPRVELFVRIQFSNN
jgi:hypothetical protein